MLIEIKKQTLLKDIFSVKTISLKVIFNYTNLNLTLGVLGLDRLSFANHGYENLLVTISPDIPPAQADSILGQSQKLCSFGNSIEAFLDNKFESIR